ncbi:hypothetical protein J5277_29535 [Rhizobium sp. 16-449-1b]|uniref:hypothetical protein n=1 Tax=Rhizobium sp. 16-449-1b TaxID=2819989 RepID=UPI001ADC52ED|nr:hypothetical protein [Rhizobium sp. 16-449-1b]MBO9198275.1 hypothetical protein [Rhizobium sp. 16-449-1b]
MLYEERFWANPAPDSRHAVCLAAANDAVSEFVRFVRDSNVGNDLVDEVELPIPKSMLVEAFTHVIAAEVRPDIRALLVKAGLTLSQYHIGLGERIKVRPIPTDTRRQPSNPFLARKFACALLLTATERTRLTEIYNTALRRGRH